MANKSEFHMLFGSIGKVVSVVAVESKVDAL